MKHEAFLGHIRKAAATGVLLAVCPGDDVALVAGATAPIFSHADISNSNAGHEAVLLQEFPKPEANNTLDHKSKTISRDSNYLSGINVRAQKVVRNHNMRWNRG